MVNHQVHHPRALVAVVPGPRLRVHHHHEVVVLVLHHVDRKVLDAQQVHQRPVARPSDEPPERQVRVQSEPVREESLDPPRAPQAVRVRIIVSDDQRPSFPRHHLPDLLQFHRLTSQPASGGERVRVPACGSPSSVPRSSSQTRTRAAPRSRTSCKARPPSASGP